MWSDDEKGSDPDGPRPIDGFTMSVLWSAIIMLLFALFGKFMMV